MDIGMDRQKLDGQTGVDKHRMGREFGLFGSKGVKRGHLVLIKVKRGQLGSNCDEKGQTMMKRVKWGHLRSFRVNRSLYRSVWVNLA